MPLIHGERGNSSRSQPCGASKNAATEAEEPAALRLMDLFSGIGGFSLGLERTGGFKTVAFCEINPKCRHLLKHHWPEVPAYDDVCGVTAERLRADGIGVDAICGGFPCQDISFAGKGAGLAGERSGLWREYARLVRELRPRYVIVENVAALLGRGLGDVLGDLAEIGYDAEWDCIRASDVGAPHRRNRLWIVAYARGEQHEGFGDAFRRALSAELHAAYANDEGEPAGAIHDEASRLSQLGELGDADCQGLPISRNARAFSASAGGEFSRAAFDGAGWWATEPDVGRVAHGVPARVDRLHGLGNAVVPAIPELIGRAILAARDAELQPRAPQVPGESSRDLKKPSAPHV